MHRRKPAKPAALKKLQATANSLESIKINLNVNEAGLNKAISSVARLKREQQGLLDKRCP